MVPVPIQLSTNLRRDENFKTHRVFPKVTTFLQLNLLASSGVKRKTCSNVLASQVQGLRIALSFSPAFYSTLKFMTTHTNTHTIYLKIFWIVI
jgi:hypothetical protein